MPWVKRRYYAADNGDVFLCWSGLRVKYDESGQPIKYKVNHWRKVEGYER